MRPDDYAEKVQALVKRVLMTLGRWRIKYLQWLSDHSGAYCAHRGCRTKWHDTYAGIKACKHHHPKYDTFDWSKMQP